MVVVECILYFYGVLMGLSVTHSIISSWHDCVDCNLITAWTKDSRAVFEIKERHSNHQLFSTILEQRRKAGSASVCYLFSKYLMAQTKISPRRWCNVCADSRLTESCSGWRVCSRGDEQAAHCSHTHTHTPERERERSLCSAVWGGRGVHLWNTADWSPEVIKHMHRLNQQVYDYWKHIQLCRLNICITSLTH